MAGGREGGKGLREAGGLGKQRSVSCEDGILRDGGEDSCHELRTLPEDDVSWRLGAWEEGADRSALRIPACLGSGIPRDSLNFLSLRASSSFLHLCRRFLGFFFYLALTHSLFVSPALPIFFFFVHLLVRILKTSLSIFVVLLLQPTRLCHVFYCALFTVLLSRDE